MTNKKANRKVKSIENRISFLENITGYSEAGERNGNGILTILDNLTDRVESQEQRMDRLNEKLNNLNDRIEKIQGSLDVLEKQLFNINEQYIRLQNTLKQTTDKIASLEESIKNHNSLMDDAITSSKLVKIMKGVGVVSAFLLSIGTIASVIAFIYNKLME